MTLGKPDLTGDPREAEERADGIPLTVGAGRRGQESSGAKELHFELPRPRKSFEYKKNIPTRVARKGGRQLFRDLHSTPGTRKWPILYRLRLPSCLPDAKIRRSADRCTIDHAQKTPVQREATQSSSEWYCNILEPSWE